MKKINFLIILNLFANCLCSQKRQIVTIFDALNCSNYAIYDENVDSICKSNDVEHLYYVKNLWRGEVEAYSKKLFGKQIKTFQLVDENLSRKINFEQIPAYYVCLIIDGHLLKTIRIDQVDERLLLKFNIYKNDVLLLNPSKTYFKDSLTLNQKRTYKLPSKIRLTDVSPILKDKNSLYIVDPLFREEIYKVNLNDSNYYLSKQLNHLVNIDSIHFYCYIDLKQENKILFDSIMYYAKIESSSEFRVFKMYMDKSNLFLLGSVKILTYIDGLFQMLNHNMVLKLDSNLNIINYYFDKKLNYNQYYPLLIGNSCPVCDESFVYTQTIREFDEVIKIKKNLIYRINETKHLLIPFRKDTLNLPFDLYNTFYSNVSGTFYNIGNAEAVWFLDPFLYL